MSVAHEHKVTWTCDTPGCPVRYEGEPALGDVPEGFYTITVRGNVMRFPMHDTGVYCTEHATVMLRFLRLATAQPVRP